MISGSKIQREEALRWIYRSNREKVCTYIKMNSGSEDEAKDVFQETVIAFYENVRDGKFKGESAISTYLYSIAKFKWLNQIKKNQTRIGHHEKVEFHDFTESPLANIIKGEKKEAVLQVLAKLGSVCKELLIQNIYYNASMKEIAKESNFSSEQIVRNKKHKCIKKLKELLTSQPALNQVLRTNG